MIAQERPRLGFVTRPVVAAALAGALLLPAEPASPGPAQKFLSGSLPGQRAGQVVLRADRLAGVHADSVSSVVLGSGRVWLARRASVVGSFGAPAGCSAAFGSAGAVVRRFSASGYSALVVGDPGAVSATGRVTIWFGGAVMDTVPDVVLDGGSAGDLFGASVAAVGDLDGDGYGDLLVGAPGAAAGAGRAYVFLGGASAPTAPALVLDGQSSGDLFGSAVSSAGRLDSGDDPEYSVGAPGRNGGAGAVYVFRGGTTLPSTPVAQVAGDTPGGYGERAAFGAALSGGSDLNRDGHADLAVGAPGRDHGRGGAFVYFGGAAVPSAPGLTVGGAEPFAHLGAALSMDSLFTRQCADLVYGQPGALGGRGRAGVIAGGATVSPVPVLDLSGAAADDRFAGSLAVAANPAGGASADLFLGACLADDPAPGSGAAYLYSLVSVGVAQASQVAVEADGEVLKPDTYVSSRPVLVLRLADAEDLSAAASSVTLDSVAVPSAQWAVMGSGSRKPGLPRGSGGAIVLTPDLAEGPHVLRARLVSASGAFEGNLQVRFLAAARLQLLSPRLWPNPFRDRVRVGFTLTRPADYSFEVYDVQGRRIHQRAPARGVAEANEFAWDGSTQYGRVASGVYFYVLSARYRGEAVSSRGRMVMVR